MWSEHHCGSPLFHSRCLFPVRKLGCFGSDVISLDVASLLAEILFYAASSTTVTSPTCLQSNTTIFDQVCGVRAGAIADVHGADHMPNVRLNESPFLATGNTDPLTFGRWGSNKNIFVTFITHPLAHSLHTVTIAVKEIAELVPVISGLHRGRV